MYRNKTNNGKNTIKTTCERETSDGGRFVGERMKKKRRKEKEKGQPAIFRIELRQNTHPEQLKLRLKKTLVRFLDPTRCWVGYWTVMEGLRFTPYKWKVLLGRHESSVVGRALQVGKRKLRSDWTG